MFKFDFRGLVFIFDLFSSSIKNNMLQKVTLSNSESSNGAKKAKKFSFEGAVSFLKLG